MGSSEILYTICPEKNFALSSKLGLILAPHNLYKVLALSPFEKYGSAPLLPRQLRLAGHCFSGHMGLFAFAARLQAITLLPVQAGREFRYFAIAVGRSLFSFQLSSVGLSNELIVLIPPPCRLAGVIDQPN